MNELAQELATHLGLKNRKPYVSSKVSENDSVSPFGHREHSSSALVTWDAFRDWTWLKACIMMSLDQVIVAKLDTGFHLDAT